MNNKVKTAIIVSVILIVAIIMVWFGYKIINSNNSSETVSNITNTQNKIKLNSVEKVNTISEKVVENNEENEVSNEVNQIDNTVATNTVENTKNDIETNEETNEEKAINIVKKNWGNEEGVYFVTMGIDAKGRYIVTVNDSSTTAIYAWYAVNIETGEFEIQ